MKKYLLASLLFIIVIVIFAVYVFWDIQKMSAGNTAATDFSSCAKFNSSVIKEQVPDTICTTESGESFVETPTSYK